MANNLSWKKIFEDNEILKHDFSKSPFYLASSQIKKATQDFKRTAEKEVRILCKMDSKESVPLIMSENGLFLIPIKNGEYAIVKGEGYFDIPEIKGKSELYNKKLDFELDTSKVGNSEMQHLDFAYASSLIRTFMDDPSLVLTIRGRKYTPEFSYNIGSYQINTKSVQTEVDAGYEGKDKIVLVEAKNSKTNNTIIRQLYYPFRQWSEYTKKEIFLLFFEKRGDDYLIWEYKFEDKMNYNSIKLVKSKKFKIVN
ncbi:hypothetical protein KAI32_03285 [Candidatus Pacearchaeota archaeon]|nr:hypothetical protein [Candidatus Pacearchaeota archaeon]